MYKCISILYMYVKLAPTNVFILSLLLPSIYPFPFPSFPLHLPPSLSYPLNLSAFPLPIHLSSFLSFTSSSFLLLSSFHPSPFPLQLIEKACSDGQVQVLKLLVGTLPETNPVMWLAHTIASLERLDSNNIAKRTSLTTVARFVFNLDPTMTMSTIVRYAEKYSKASLYLINQFCNQTKNDKHFVMCGVALMSIPVRWIDNSKYTHINLTNNLLTFLPKEIFQLSGLRSLNLSHNCLESIPSILKWNCSKLKELDLSFNRLVDERYFILEGRKPRDNRVNKNPPNNEVQRDQINAAQRLLRLTGYNLYPCVCSLSKVSISHNIGLSQVSYLVHVFWCLAFEVQCLLLSFKASCPK